MATVINRYPHRVSIAALAFAGLRAQQAKEKKRAKDEPEEPAAKKPAAKRKPMREAKKAKPADKSQLAVPKENASQHGTYMAIVRRLNCRGCGAPPPSEKKGNEFCHRNKGKGKGLKTDVREGWPGCRSCHREIDEGGLPREERRRIEAERAASTRAEVEAKGLWPKTLPKWKGRA